MLEHNKIVYEEVIERLKTSSRVCIVQATGTGKGVIASSLIEDYVKVLVVAPTNAILENYRMNLGVNSENVIFYTYQGISMLLNNQIEELGEKVSLIILDEFHRIGAETWGRKVEMLCDRAEAKGCKTVGLSATPVRYLDNERDMSEEFFKGNVVNGLNIVDAVVSGVLPTFKYVISYYGYEKDLFKKFEERKEKVSNEIKQIVSNLENNYSIGKIIQKETKELSNNQKWVVFFSKIEELEDFKDKIYSWFNGKVNVFILHSQSNYSGNMKVLKEFNNSNKDINVLLSVNMLNEGVHIKDIDGVIMMRKTISPIVYLQQLGRALQIGGKSPIIFDFIGNLKRIDKHNDFSLNIIEDINNKFHEIYKEDNSKKEQKIIVHSYCEEIFDVLRNIYYGLYNIKWTDEEYEILNKYYPVGGARLCMKNGLKRTHKTIITRARILGLKYENYFYTQEEDEIVKKYYSIGGYKLCQEKGLDRDNVSISGRARNLGILVEERCVAWSEEEMNILKTYYPLGGYKLCQEKGLNKSKQNIFSHASKYNLSKKRQSQFDVWTEKEKDILRKYYLIGGTKLCLENGLAHRGKFAVQGMASKMGLKNNFFPAWTEEENEIIKKYYPIGGSKLCQENGLKYKTKSAINQKARKLNLKYINNNVWSIEELEILKKYYPIGSYKLCQERGLGEKSKSDIYNKASLLGLKVNEEDKYKTRIDNWTEEELKILLKYYQLGGYKLCQENGLSHRSRNSIIAKAHNLKIIVEGK